MSEEFDKALKDAKEALKQIGKPQRKKILVREGPRSYTAYEDELVERIPRRSPTRLMDMLERIASKIIGRYAEETLIKHRAGKDYRFKDNPLEKLFADEWERVNTRPNNRSLLEDLMGDGSRPGPISDRDALVAARVVQWFGTHVGECFLSDVLSRPQAEQLRKRIEHEMKTIRPRGRGRLPSDEDTHNE